jgi:hypothetical protein
MNDVAPDERGGLEGYSRMLERVAAGEAEPSLLHEASAAYLAGRLPDRLRELGALYFGMLDAPGDVRPARSWESAEGPARNPPGTRATAPR